MDIHPKQQEAQALASDRQKKRQKLLEVIKTAKASGIRFVQVGNTTIAYVKRLQIIHFSTAIRSPKDPFDIITGRSLAAARFQCGEFATLRMRPKMSAKLFFEILGFSLS